MTDFPSSAQRTTLSHWLAGACLALGLAAATGAQAVPLDNFVFDGSGNVSIFDSAAGTGGWVGALTEFGGTQSFVSFVTFQYDSASNQLNGQFEFTDAMDLSSTLFGSVSGSFTDPNATLDSGGQWSLDYSVAGGMGQYAGASGFGLSFLTFDPQSMAFDNYAEQGLLVVAVPEPGTYALMAAGLGLLALRARRRTV